MAFFPPVLTGAKCIENPPRWHNSACKISEFALLKTAAASETPFFFHGLPPSLRIISFRWSQGTLDPPAVQSNLTYVLHGGEGGRKSCKQTPDFQSEISISTKKFISEGLGDFMPVCVGRRALWNWWSIICASVVCWIEGLPVELPVPESFPGHKIIETAAICWVDTF